MERASVDRQIPFGFSTGWDHTQTPAEWDTEASWPARDTAAEYHPPGYAPPRVSDALPQDRIEVVRKYLDLAGCELGSATSKLSFY